MYRLWPTILLIVTLDTLGDMFVSRGMKQIGPLKSLRSQTLLSFVMQVATNVLLGLGFICSALSFLVYLWLLSWTQLSLAVPATALIFVLGTLGARVILHEYISPARWMGTVLIGLGIALISLE
jgi:drug/metabolite transporter (DMT)-like permease